MEKLSKEEITKLPSEVQKDIYNIYENGDLFMNLKKVDLVILFNGKNYSYTITSDNYKKIIEKYGKKLFLRSQTQWDFENGKQILKDYILKDKKMVLMFWEIYGNIDTKCIDYKKNSRIWKNCKFTNDLIRR